MSTQSFSKNSLSRKTLALLLAAILLISTFAAVFAADTIVRPIVKAVSVSPKDAVVNEMITFTVTTDLTATKVRISNQAGETYYLADISQGFANYVDSSDSRIWTISKKAQALGSNSFLVYAGNYRVYSASGVSVSCTVYRNIAEVPGSGVTTTTPSTSSVTPTTTDPSTSGTTSPDKTDPPYPFWKVSTTYTGGETVYYKGKIYQCNWWSEGTPPDQLVGQSWTLIGDAEWTVPEDPKNYEDDESDEPQIGVVETLTDAQVEEIWGGIDPRYTSEASLSRLEDCLPKSYYDELFPYRFGSDGWKSMPDDAYYKGANRQNQPDYYSYDNLKQAVSELSNLMIKLEWFEDSQYCYRITRLDKTTKQQVLVFQQEDWTQPWNKTKTPVYKIIDFGTFLAEGSDTDKKRELAAFLANISHETGGGNVEGIYPEIQTGLYFNEETTHIGATSSGYTSANYPSVPGHSYHGRGPIQTSWNYNYGQLSGIVYGDINILLENPERLASDGVLGFKAAIQFWMTPQPPKPSCHDVITNQWTPDASAIAGGITQACFGTVVMVINGGLEGNCSTDDYRVGRRARYYTTFAAKMGIDVSGEKVDTLGMTKF